MNSNDAPEPDVVSEVKAAMGDTLPMSCSRNVSHLWFALHERVDDMLTAGEVRHWLRALVARCETAEQTPSAGEAALVIRSATAEARAKRAERELEYEKGASDHDRIRVLEAIREKAQETIRADRLERNWEALIAWLDPRLSIMIRSDRVIDKMAEITKEQA